MAYLRPYKKLKHAASLVIFGDSSKKLGTYAQEGLNLVYGIDRPGCGPGPGLIGTGLCLEPPAFASRQLFRKLQDAYRIFMLLNPGNIPLDVTAV